MFKIDNGVPEASAILARHPATPAVDWLLPSVMRVDPAPTPKGPTDYPSWLRPRFGRVATLPIFTATCYLLSQPKSPSRILILLFRSFLSPFLALFCRCPFAPKNLTRPSCGEGPPLFPHNLQSYSPIMLPSCAYEPRPRRYE
ncbi:MAG: hypothetical protein LQ341_004884 [Variospora aurantia]|nr:MAG: hypothetical protein LQ341_004884 [Variospora aurantia]